MNNKDMVSKTIVNCCHPTGSPAKAIGSQRLTKFINPKATKFQIKIVVKTALVTTTDCEEIIEKYIDQDLANIYAHQLELNQRRNKTAG